MPTKTDRILSYLPGTFKRQAQLSALLAVVDAFGQELLKGENSLAAIMQSHWVDHADRGSDVIDDLARIAALYGLAPRCETPPDPPLLCALPPRCDETVEEFREHLKRYIGTFLDGTVTVQGILRIAAENLGLRIADEYEDMDTWWMRSNDQLVTWRPFGDDVSNRLFGFTSAHSTGQAARPATIWGTADLSGGVDLSATPIFRLVIDDQSAVEIDLLEGRTDPVTPLNWITTVINNAVGSDQVAGQRDGKLTLRSINSGADAALTVLGGPKDASPALLGILSRRATGRGEAPAAVTGQIDLSGGVDLTADHFIRLVIDGNAAFEIELPNQPAVTLDQLVTEINGAISEVVASHDDRYLTLTSTTIGFSSTLKLETSAAQDATRRLFGEITTFFTGQDAQPARFQGTADLSGGVDLSERATIALAIDDQPLVTINCAGSDPAHTRLSEIIAAVNDVVGQAVALHNGRFVTITSPTVGPVGSIEFEIAPGGEDASDLIMGLTARNAIGEDATTAIISGSTVHDRSVNLVTEHKFKIAVDGQPAVEVDLHHGPADRTAASLVEIVQVINEQLGADIAQHDGQRVMLFSPTSGDGSSLVLLTREERIRRRFVTRAAITDDAAQLVLGFIEREAAGSDGTFAKVVGQKDVSRGVDLRETRYLRLAIDERNFIDIDCAGARPHATTIDEIVNNINIALGGIAAAHDTLSLSLTSSKEGSAGRIAFDTPQATDALSMLLGEGPAAAVGTNATGVRLVGTVDLSAGIDLAAGSTIQLGVDGSAPVDVVLTTETENMSINRIVNAINNSLGLLVATTDGSRLILKSPTTGATSELTVAVAPSGDVAAALLGFDPPRTYRGRDAVPARIDGVIVIDQPLDLTTRRFLAISLDGAPSVAVDCAAVAVDPATVTLTSVIGSINTELRRTVASEDGGRLVLSSISTGSAARIAVEHHLHGDARERLFGDVPDETTGEDPLPAVITGDIELLDSVDLAERSVLRLQIDGQRPIDLSLSGPNPAASFLDEMVAALNEAVPGLAAAVDDRLQLTSSTAGANSRLRVQPLRYLEMIEYPPGDVKQIENQAAHGQKWVVINSGAADTFAEITMTSASGVSGPGLINHTMNAQLRLLMSFAPGDVIRLASDGQGYLIATVQGRGDPLPRPIPSEKIVVGLCNDNAKIQPKTAASDVLRLPRGRSDWQFLSCLVSRFDEAHFDYNHYANGVCPEPAIFGVSCFGQEGSAEPIQAVFAEKSAPVGALTNVQLAWRNHQPAAFTVNLPVDLHPRYGARFDQSRFGLAPDNPELYEAVVASPIDDPAHLVTQVAARDRALIEAVVVPIVPLGWESFEIPFRYPRFLTLGRDDQKAALYLSAEGLDGFIRIRAHEPGEWGNELAVSVRPAGPAVYDVCIVFEGGRFENARQAVAGEPVPPLAQEMAQVGPVGVLKAKAAGVLATVTRERVD